MTDVAVRRAERASAASGCDDDEAKLLNERLRVGTLTHDQVVLAAYLGHSAARILVPHKPACQISKQSNYTWEAWDGTTESVGLGNGSAEHWVTGLAPLLVASLTTNHSVKRLQNVMEHVYIAAWPQPPRPVVDVWLGWAGSISYKLQWSRSASALKPAAEQLGPQFRTVIQRAVFRELGL